MKTFSFSQVLLGLLLAAPMAFAGKPGYPNDAADAKANRATYDNCKNEKRATVVGSSVTLGFFGDSPAIVYLERAGFKRRCIQKKSFPISDSEGLLGWLKESVTEFKPNVIIALDFMIHDVSFEHSEEHADERVATSLETVDYLKSVEMPVVIGTVFASRPAQYPFQIDIAKKINQRLCAEAVAAPNKFFVLPIARIYKSIYSDSFTMPGTDRVFKKDELLTDMYHPGPRGAYMLSNKMIESLNAMNASRGFPYSAGLFDLDEVMSHRYVRPELQALNPMANEKTLFNKHGEDTLAIVNAGTIPEELGDEGCP